VLVVREEALAVKAVAEILKDPGSPYGKLVLSTLGNDVLPQDASFSIQHISTLEKEPEKSLLTKEELVQRLQDGAKMEDLFSFRPGQDCEIFKTRNLVLGDKIIYIPDLSLNRIPTGRTINAPEEIQEILTSCYTGNEFLQECDGNSEMAERLFWYCDWQHPSSAFPEIQDDYGD